MRKLDDNILSQEIHQIHLDLPDVDLLLFKNSDIFESHVKINKNMRDKINLPTMYQNWAGIKNNHLSFEWVDGCPVIRDASSKNLLIFDTWGTSSYYHLLVDHILPIWITREWLVDTIGVSVEDVEYFRISKNNYPTELASIQDIFLYFIGKNFTESASGTYRNILYGYFYNYRPYLGPKYPLILYPNYQNFLKKFRAEFGKFEKRNYTGRILVPMRNNRTSIWVDRFLQKYSHRINFITIDFAKLSMHEQVNLAGSAQGIFGNEGAAFANMLFMADDSLVVPVGQQSDSFFFLSTLSAYIPHQFKSVLVDSSGFSNVKDDDVLRFLERG